MLKPDSADFIITGDEKYLAPYENARQRLPQIFDQLGHADVIAQRPQTLGAIENLANVKLNELAETIALRKEHGFEAATEVVREGFGRETMDKLRDQIHRLQDQQEAALEAEHRAADSATRTRTMAFALTGLANLLFIGWAYRRIVRAITTREAAWAEVEQQRTEVQRQKDLLAVTLASIGDCVIVTDTLGRITFMNTVAEELTGWSFNEASSPSSHRRLQDHQRIHARSGRESGREGHAHRRYRWSRQSHASDSKRWLGVADR